MIPLRGAMISAEDEGRLTRVPIGLPDELHEWVREQAHQRRVSMAAVVREALREYRRRQEGPQLGLPIVGEGSTR